MRLITPRAGRRPTGWLSRWAAPERRRPATTVRSTVRWAGGEPGEDARKVTFARWNQPAGVLGVAGEGVGTPSGGVRCARQGMPRSVTSPWAAGAATQPLAPERAEGTGPRRRAPRASV